MAARKKTKAPYVIVRGSNVGVHAGELIEDKKNHLVLRNARRIWYWEGAGSLSGLAVYGPSMPAECKFGAAVEHQELRGLDDAGDYEVIHCTAAGEAAIRAVAEWRA